MTQKNRLKLWLDNWSGRVRHRAREITIAVMLGCLLAITAIAALVGFRVAYDPVWLNSLRLLLLAVLALSFWLLYWRPRQQLETDPASRELEQRIPELAGELRTYIEASDPTSKKANPFLPLMAGSILDKLAQNHPRELVSNRFLNSLRALSATSLILLLVLLFAPSDNLRFGSQHFLLGWLMPDRLPPQSLAVTPGDTLIKRGTNLTLSASATGFNPADALVYARFDTSDWEAVPMRKTAQGFEFSFFGVHEALDYYVEAAGVRSQSYRVDVIDLPNLQSLTIHYSYPDWTGLEDRTQETGTRIQGVEGTRISLEIETDMPLRDGELLVNGERVPIDVDGNLATASLTLQDSGEYFLAERLGSEVIRITNDYDIAVLEDREPSIALRVPGGDRGATNIEEVPISVEVRDDYRVDQLALYISVNAGEWQRIELPSGEQSLQADHLLELENIAFQTAEESGSEPLVPGDLISYYVEAADHNQRVTSDIYFIDVQPFDKRYSRAEGGAGAGGMAGAGGGGGEDEISQRQREILAATWNLQKARDRDEEVDQEYLEDNAFMLSELQRTLAEQTQTTLDRLDARRLLVDPQAQAFAENLELALEQMDPAANHLQETELDDSVPPQQKALQYLLRAEAQFRDIQIAMQQENQGGGAGGGGQQRDLAEIYELEMDMSRNQYETRQSPALQQPDQVIEDAFNELEELARRQEELAEQARRNQEMTLADRWQQEQLTRQAEELREQLDQMQQQGGEQTAAEQRAADQLRQNLDEIIDQMRNASGEQPQPGDPAGQPGQNDGSAEQSAQAASDQLRQTLDELSEARQQAFRENVTDIARQARDLERRQEVVEDELAGALDRAMAERRTTGNYTSGLDGQREQQLADEKRAMADTVTEMESRIDDLVSDFQGQLPRSSSALQDAADVLDEERLGARLADAAEAIEYGMAPQVSVREFVVSDAVRRLRERAETAADLATMESARNTAGQDTEQSPSERLADLREQLAANLPGPDQMQAAAGSPDAEGESAGASDQPGQTTAAGGQANPQDGTAIGGANRAGGGDVRGGVRVGDFTFRNPLTAADLLDGDRITEDASQVAAELLAISNQLLAAGLTDQQIIEAQQMARELSAERGDSERIADSLRGLISQLEKLELGLSGDPRADTIELRPGSGSAAQDDEDTADYFRNLNTQ